jgi:hypothetical protein
MYVSSIMNVVCPLWSNFIYKIVEGVKVFEKLLKKVS